MHCSVEGGGSEESGGCRTCLRGGTQQRTRGAVEAPEGQRSAEVMWLRRRGEEEEGCGGGGRERRTDDVRGSEVLRLRHGGRLGEAGEDAQHGSILSQETLVHPPQALDLSQSRESLQRGGEREIQQRGADREERESVQGGRPCAKRKDSRRGRVQIHSHRRAPTHSHRQTDRQGRTTRSEGQIRKNLYNRISTQQGEFGEETAKAATSKQKSPKPLLPLVCVHQNACGERRGAQVFLFFFFMCTAFQKEREVKFSPKPFPKKFHTSMRV